MCPDYTHGQLSAFDTQRAYSWGTKGRWGKGPRGDDVIENFKMVQMT